MYVCLKNSFLILQVCLKTTPISCCHKQKGDYCYFALPAVIVLAFKI